MPPLNWNPCDFGTYAGWVVCLVRTSPSTFQYLLAFFRSFGRQQTAIRIQANMKPETGTLTEIVRWPAILEAALPWETVVGTVGLWMVRAQRPPSILSDPSRCSRHSRPVGRVLSQVSYSSRLRLQRRFLECLYRDLGVVWGIASNNNSGYETLVLTARSPDTSFPAIDIKQEIPEDVCSFGRAAFKSTMG